ncbi:MAG: hypothetical protein PGN11_05840 [Quadrisphaera sp.]
MSTDVHTPAAQALAVQRAITLGAQHVVVYPDGTPLHGVGVPSVESVLTECWPNHDPLCECEESEAVTDAYYDGWMEIAEAPLRKAEETLQTLVEFMIREHTPTGEHACRCGWTSKSKTQTAEFHRAGVVSHHLVHYVEKVQAA